MVTPQPTTRGGASGETPPSLVLGQRTQGRAAGFTLLEVLIAILIALIGLMGTVAIQQTLLVASGTANDASAAMRLAMQQIEELQSRIVQPNSTCTGAIIDELAPLVVAGVDFPVPVEFRNTRGRVNPDGATTFSPEYRFAVQRWVRTDATQIPPPYQISVRVRYNLGAATLDSTNPEGTSPKEVRIDILRRKCF